MTTKHDKVVTYYEQFSPITSDTFLNMWSRWVTQQIKNISPLSQYLWSQDLSGWWHAAKIDHWNSIDPSMRWSFEVTWQIKSHLHLQTKHVYRTRQAVELPWVYPTLKAKWLFDHMTTTTKLNRVLTYRRRFTTQTCKWSPTYCYIFIWLLPKASVTRIGVIKPKF